jgi:serine/threonine-protein kinase RsbW
MLIEKKVYNNVNREVMEEIKDYIEKWCANKLYNTFEVIVVLYELYNNAVKYSDDAVDIILKFYKNSIVIRVDDQGDGFKANEWLKISTCDLKKNINKPCGRGIYIVKNFVSKIYYNAKGNSVVVKINSGR